MVLEARDIYVYIYAYIWKHQIEFIASWKNMFYLYILGRVLLINYQSRCYCDPERVTQADMMFSPLSTMVHQCKKDGTSSMNRKDCG
jgi:hypothetical protein